MISPAFWRASAAHEDGHPNDALVADHREFGRRAVLQAVEQRHNARDREVHMVGFAARLEKHLPERHVEFFKQWRPLLINGARQR
jgi:hypothetical protein